MTTTLSQRVRIKQQEAEDRLERKQPLANKLQARVNKTSRPNFLNRDNIQKLLRHESVRATAEKLTRAHSETRLNAIKMINRARVASNTRLERRIKTRKSLNLARLAALKGGTEGRLTTVVAAAKTTAEDPIAKTDDPAADMDTTSITSPSSAPAGANNASAQDRVSAAAAARNQKFRDFSTTVASLPLMEKMRKLRPQQQLSEKILHAVLVKCDVPKHERHAFLVELEEAAHSQQGQGMSAGNFLAFVERHRKAKGADLDDKSYQYSSASASPDACT